MLTKTTNQSNQKLVNTATYKVSIYLSIYLSIHLSIYLSFYLSIYLSIYLSTYLSNKLNEFEEKAFDYLHDFSPLIHCQNNNFGMLRFWHVIHSSFTKMSHAKPTKSNTQVLRSQDLKLRSLELFSSRIIQWVSFIEI